MDFRESVQANLGYFRQLLGSGWDGVVAARRDGRVLAHPSWTPLALGAAVGMIAAERGGRRTAGRLAAGALAGTAVGVGAAVTWASRRFLTAAARSAASRVNTTRDAHWLESHPIDYA